jgi:hypothetical protein
MYERKGKSGEEVPSKKARVEVNHIIGESGHWVVGNFDASQHAEQTRVAQSRRSPAL